MQQILALGEAHRSPSVRGASSCMVDVLRDGPQLTPREQSCEASGDASFRQRVLQAAGGTQWYVAPELVTVLFDDRGLRLSQWQQSGQAEVIKTGRHRTVYRISLPCGNFYLKHYKVSGPRDLLQNIVRPCRASLEFDAAAQVARAGVATIETVALGKTRMGRLVADSFLLCREIEETEPLDCFVRNHSSAARRPRTSAAIAEALGKLTAALHRAGLIHRDYHAGNILIRCDDDRVRLWLIDLHAVSRCRYLTRSRVEANLAQLNNFFVNRVSATDRHRFFRAYWNAFHATGAAPSEALADAFPVAVRRLKRVFHQTVADAYRKGDRKWSRGNRRLIIADTKTTRCRGLSRLGLDLIARLRDEPDSVLSAAMTQQPEVAAGNPTPQTCALATPAGVIRAAIAIFEPGSVAGTDEAISRFNGESPVILSAAKDLRATFAPRSFAALRMTRDVTRQSTARHAWETGHALLRRGIDVAKPLLFVEPAKPHTGPQLLLTEVPPRTMTLRKYLGQLDQLDDGRRESRLRRIGKRLALQLRRLHELGFEHRRLSPEGILVTDQPQLQKVWFTALADIRQLPWPAAGDCAQSLAGLDASVAARCHVRNTHKLRFLRHYLGSRFPREWKRLWRAVASHEHPGDQSIIAPQVQPASKAA